MTKYALTPIYACKLVREGSAKTQPKLNNTAKAMEVAGEILKDSPCEQIVCIMLDTKLKVIGATVVTVGTLDASLVHPREFFRPAILHNSAHVIAAHNHPSGDLTPSRQDHDVHERLKKAGEILGIQMVDFLIVNAEGEALSFAESGPFKLIA